VAALFQITQSSQEPLSNGMFLLGILAALPLLLFAALIVSVSAITPPLFLMSLVTGIVACMLARNVLRRVRNLDQAGH
jgi:hypothetical protein